MVRVVANCVQKQLLLVFVDLFNDLDLPFEVFPKNSLDTVKTIYNPLGLLIDDDWGQIDSCRRCVHDAPDVVFVDVVSWVQIEVEYQRSRFNLSHV
jgi:hypothetical protein